MTNNNIIDILYKEWKYKKDNFIYWSNQANDTAPDAAKSLYLQWQEVETIASQLLQKDITDIWALFEGMEDEARNN